MLESLFYSPIRGCVHNSCKRLSSARAARSPAFHAGVTCKSLHRNWGTCRHGRQRGTSRADEEKGPNLNRGKTTMFAPERDGTLSRVSTDLARSISSTFLYTLRDRLLRVLYAAGRVSNALRLCMIILTYIHVRLNLRVS